MDVMHGDGSVETAMDCTTLDVRLADVTFHVEMNWVATEAERLPRVRDLNVIEVCHCKALSCFFGERREWWIFIAMRKNIAKKGR